MVTTEWPKDKIVSGWSGESDVRAQVLFEIRHEILQERHPGNYPVTRSTTI